MASWKIRHEFIVVVLPLDVLFALPNHHASTEAFTLELTPWDTQSSKTQNKCSTCHMAVREEIIEGGEERENRKDVEEY